MRKNRKIDAAQQRRIMEELYEVYEQKMFGVAKAILGNDWQAEDAVSEAFIRLVRYLPQCQDVSSIKTKTLITRVIKSAAIDIYRKNKRTIENISVEENTWIEDRHNVIESYLASMAAKDLLAEIDKGLPAIYKDVVRLRCYGGLPVSEVSKILGISEDTVYQRLTRAKKFIREKIGDEIDVKEKLG